jgi:hypothetical protein
MSYYYISLEDLPDAEVRQVALPRLGSPLLGDKPMPIKYAIQRKGYTITTTINPAVFGPRMTVVAADSTGKPLILTPRPDRVPNTRNTRPCGTYDVRSEGRVFEYAWVICLATEGEEERVISFDVAELASGAVIGEEALRFALIRNGLYLPFEGV